MMKSVVRGPIDDLLERVAGDEIRVVDQDGPEVDEDEEAKVEVAVERKDVDDEVVWHRLQVAVERVERVGCERRRN